MRHKIFFREDRDSPDSRTFMRLKAKCMLCIVKQYVSNIEKVHNSIDLVFPADELHRRIKSSETFREKRKFATSNVNTTLRVR